MDKSRLEDAAEQSNLRAGDGVFAFGRYLLLLAVAAIALYAWPFVMVRQSGFDRWSNSSEGATLEYGFETAGANADVVIFGESSALHGVDPNQITTALNLKTLNLPNTLGSLVVSGDVEMRQYLHHNSKPKLIVIYLAPWDLNYLDLNDFRKLYEGEEMLMRHGSASDIFHFAISRPLEFLQFPFRFHSSNSIFGILQHLRKPASPSEIAANYGYLPNPDPRRLTETCKLPASFMIAQPSTKSTQALIDRYANSADRIMVYIAPIPSCQGSQWFESQSYEGLHAAPPKTVAPGSVVDDNSYIHLDPAAVRQATQNLIEAIRRTLVSSSGGRD